MKKFISMLCVISLIFMLIGCQAKDKESSKENDSNLGSNKETNVEKNDSKVDGKESEKVKVSILQGAMEDFPPDIDANNNEIVKAINEKLPNNIELEWILVPRFSMTEKKTLMMSTGDYPDIVQVNTNEMVDWAEKGLIIPLDDIYKDHYKNIYNYLSEEDLKRSKYNGKTYGICLPSTNLWGPQMMYIRTDWLKNLNLEMPKTTDELFEVLKAFTFNDPDGNGKDDTFGICDRKGFPGFTSILSCFDVQFSYWSKVNDEIIPDIIRPEMKDALAYLNSLYTAGVMDKDTLTNNMDMLEAKFESGSIGMMGSAAWTQNARTIPNLEKTVKGAEVATWIPYIGDKPAKFVRQRPGKQVMYAVTIGCKHPEAVLDVFNWMIDFDKSVEPIKALNAETVFGQDMINRLDDVIGGKYYAEKNQTKLSGEDLVDRSLRISYQFTSTAKDALSPEEYIEYAKESVKLGSIGEQYPKDIELCVNNSDYNDMNISGKVYAELWNDIYTYWEEISVGIITGTVSIDKFDEWVDFFYSNGGQDIIDEVTEMNK